jgi:hypothetical protein
LAHRGSMQDPTLGPSWAYGIGSLLNSIGSLLNSIGSLLNSIGSLLNSIGSLLNSIGSLLNSIGSLLNSYSIVNVNVNGFGCGLEANWAQIGCKWIRLDSRRSLEFKWIHI